MRLPNNPMRNKRWIFQLASTLIETWTVFQLKFNFRVPVAELFNFETIAKISSYLRRTLYTCISRLYLHRDRSLFSMEKLFLLQKVARVFVAFNIYSHAYPSRHESQRIILIRYTLRIISLHVRNVSK